MILSYNWLKELTQTRSDPKELAAILTRAGLNIEETTPIDGDFALNAEITTNRPDWLCHLGVAHEIAAIQNLSVRAPAPSLRETGPDVAALSSVTVMPGAAEICPRYTLRVVRSVRVGPSPHWLRNRLVAIGQRSINNIVDITNLVCFEMNQPLHAFDLDKLAGGRIVLRLAREGELFTAITGEGALLGSGMLVIADAEKAVALAGVKGGANTEVDGTTRNVLLESAWFQPRGIRRAARSTRMSSESSYRYERGIDPGMTERASARAAGLLLELAGGELAAGVLDTNPELGKSWEVSMRYSRCDKLLGFPVPPDEISRIFKGLGLAETRRDTTGATLRIPTFRQDLKREADLIEEVIRLAGYDRIPEKISMPLALAHVTPETRTARLVRRILVALGYHECVTDSFVPEAWGRTFAPAAVPYTVRNPVNALRPVLRPALVPSLLETRQVNRLFQDVRLFEIGRTYRRNRAESEERDRLAILDDRGPRHVRGALEAVVAALNLAGTVTLRPVGELPGMAPGSGGELAIDGTVFATAGETAVAVAGSFDLPIRPGLGEADLAVLAKTVRKERAYRQLPRFPGVRRDISLSLPEAARWDEVRETAARSATLLESLAFESLYRGPGLEPGRKGIAFSMLLRAPDRSLTDTEANAIRDRVARAILAAFPGSALR
ncbi:MAG: phenylalanine--tRNA ligase subunit beta [Planctomycetota bacterium]|jgi:phenylalanyl-tRNA synthetase beta chain|nr:phenylalanine--tRNA ligase subunit beta [Planctomycetota bacterium]